MSKTSMNKSDLIRIVSVKNDLPLDQAEAMVNQVFETMAEGLTEGKRIELRGFGTFQVREYGGYLGRNPRTGDPVSVAPKRLPFFKMGKEVKEAVNGN